MIILKEKKYRIKKTKKRGNTELREKEFDYLLLVLLYLLKRNLPNFEF